MCLSVYEEILGSEFFSDSIINLFNSMWAMSGDFISKIYAGTSSVLTSITLKGKENMLDQIHHGITSVKRFLKQNLSDDFK